MPKKPFTHSGRDAWGASHGQAGKGDAPRYKHDENYVNNYEAIDWKRGAEPQSKKFRKVYGTLKKPFTELAAEDSAFSGRKDR